MTQAIFLSYASSDADAARRIAEALRAAGLEVWFDRSELRGGVAQDAGIRTIGLTRILGSQGPQRARHRSK
jgi:hypothetical protein